MQQRIWEGGRGSCDEVWCGSDWIWVQKERGILCVEIKEERFVSGSGNGKMRRSGVNHEMKMELRCATEL